MNHPAMRLTPSNSPFFKNTTPRSPTRSSKNEEPGLRLSKVIGTTTTSANGFACLPEARKFAYIAGAAAVVATIGDGLKITQNFFRARPNLSSNTRESSAKWPVTPTHNEPRSRAFGHVKEQNVGGSPLGASGRDWSDSQSGRTLTANHRVKAATSVALSPDGRWLAVGETGYKPRVLIFSLADGSAEVPVCLLTEHTFGVHALSFSSDSRRLASLGTVNDGFLYIWSVDDRSGSATLHSSNKCTTLVNSMCWMGSSIVTVGLRFIKVWRPDEDEAVDSRKIDVGLSPLPLRPKADNRSSDFGNSILSPKHKVLTGKNSLLGDMLDANFVSAIPIADTKALICAESGEICLLNDLDKAQSLTALASVDFEVASARAETDGRFVVVGSREDSHGFDIAELCNMSLSTTKTRQQRRRTINPIRPSLGAHGHIVATGTVGDSVVELDTKNGISIKQYAACDKQDHDNDTQDRIITHSDAVLGVQAFNSPTATEAAFFTFSASGSIYIWSSECGLVAQLNVPIETHPHMHDLANELSMVSASKNEPLMAAGDRYGNLTIVDARKNAAVTRVRAHSSEIITMHMFERSQTTLLATGSRDRTVQLFAWVDAKLNLLQTMDEHAGAVTSILVGDGGNRLLSSSVDRTIVVREATLRDESNPASIMFIILRTVTLKASPTSMCFGTHADEILVSATDRSIGRYSIKTGQSGFSFKCSDTEGGEAAVMSKILYEPSLNGNPTIIGISSSDKSVRLYTEFGSLIARDYGHTEGITDITLLSDPANSAEDLPKYARLVTVAADSTIFMWETSPASTRDSGDLLAINDAPEGTPVAKALAMGPPLRKVISYSELSRLRREKSIDEEGTSPREGPGAPIPASPQRIRRRPSRMSVAQAPKLEPAIRTNFADPSRRRSLHQRSPSPPSPRTVKKDARPPSLGTSVRSRSSENVTTTAKPSSPAASGFGSLTSSTESVSRSLRAYRKKLAGPSSNENIASEALRELERELKLTARMLGEKLHGKTLDEATLAKLLDQASEKIVGMLDERIKERVESEVRKGSEASPVTVPQHEATTEMSERNGPSDDTIAGASHRVALSE